MAIVDASYQPWNGARQGRLRRIAAIARVGIGLAFDGAVPKVMLFACYAMSAAAIAIIYLGHAFHIITPFAKGNLLLRDHLSNPMLSLLVMLLTAVVGARLISRDIRTNATAMYFSKAITPLDYLAAKFAVIAIFLLSATFLPTVALWVGQYAIGSEEVGWLQRLGDLGSMGLHSLVMVVPASAVILAFSSLGKTAYVPGALWILLRMGSGIVGAILENKVNEPWCKLATWGHLVDRVGQACYAAREVKTKQGVDKMPELAAVMDFPWWVPGIILAAATLISFAVVMYRLNALERRE